MVKDQRRIGGRPGISLVHKHSDTKDSTRLASVGVHLVSSLHCPALVGGDAGAGVTVSFRVHPLF